MIKLMKRFQRLLTLSTVGFDGYEKRSTKDHEHAGSMQKQQPSAEVIVKQEMTVHHTR